ncbi:hypothetical protein BV22DRAFT_1027542 [Leucogyrophana mollusca]|uniref:Uncharacterized protein n=1 Tax=Leucogyrophana mollusca TaxID=85980 RepID=A0ACB8BZW0_9AGAM|nr:hypothetical protein BV22DRAFT_1027542 [Leucogyrophana mollusca]
MLLKLSARDIGPPPYNPNPYYNIELYPGYNLSGKPEHHTTLFSPPSNQLIQHECSVCMTHKYMTEKNAKHTGLYSFKYTTQDYHKGKIVSMNLRLYSSADCKHELHNWTNSWIERWMPPYFVGAKSHKVCGTY